MGRRNNCEKEKKVMIKKKIKRKKEKRKGRVKER